MFYGKVYSAFWSDPDVKKFDEFQIILSLYLLTCKHKNSLGCFYLPKGYVLSDIPLFLKAEKGFGNPLQRVDKAFSELKKCGFVFYCEETSWVFIRKYLFWNKPENPNQGLGIEYQFNLIPKSFSYFNELAQSILTFTSELRTAKTKKGDQYFYMRRPFIKGLETLCQGFGNRIRISNNNIRVSNNNNINIKSNKKKDTNNKYENEINIILTKINLISKKDYRDSGNIPARLKDGFTVDQLLQIVETKQHDPHFKKNNWQYFNPMSLFTKKNTGIYLQQKPEDFYSKNGSGVDPEKWAANCQT